MKQQENNEIDSLLRSWAGRRPAGGADVAGNGAGGHLDADELNSYAEGVLPPAARARYTAHLIDCDDCRRLAAKLAVAAGPVVTERSIDPQPDQSSWRKALAAIFAPPVLRFAVPALLLVAVGIVFFAKRPSNERASVALDTRTTQSQSASEPAPAKSFDNFRSDGNAPSTATRNSATPAADAAVANAKKPEREEDKKDQTVSGTAAGPMKEAPKEEPVLTADKRVDANAVAQPTTTVASPPPPASKPASAGAVAPGGSDVAKVTAPKDVGKGEYTEKKLEVRGEAARTVDEVGTGRKQSADRDEQRQKAKSLRAAERSNEGADQESESRSIAGRNFQRRGSVWVDSAYKSSMSTVNVTRGSDQYRALVADEPAIGTIANQLGGEIFVVWKSRAYHIK